jgi:hypothetical protein
MWLALSGVVQYTIYVAVNFVTVYARSIITIFVTIYLMIFLFEQFWSY